jgi:hypothetical protein
MFGCPLLPIARLSTPSLGHLQEEVPYEPGMKETCINHPWLAGGGGVLHGGYAWGEGNLLCGCAATGRAVATPIGTGATTKASGGVVFTVCC